jgi:hypothetical protein
MAGRSSGWYRSIDLDRPLPRLDPEHNQTLQANTKMTLSMATITVGILAFAAAMLCGWMLGSSLGTGIAAALSAAFYAASGAALSRVGLAPGFSMMSILLFKSVRSLVLGLAMILSILAFELDSKLLALAFVTGIFVAGIAEFFLITNKNSNPIVTQ